MIQPLVWIQARRELSRWNIKASFYLKVSQPLEIESKSDLRPKVKAIKWKRGNEGGANPCQRQQGALPGTVIMIMNSIKCQPGLQRIYSKGPRSHTPLVF